MKKQRPLLIASGIVFILFSQNLYAQGCVAIRPMSGCTGISANSVALTKGQWQAGANYRYFRSFRHYRGDSEQKERLEQNTEVINYAHSMDLGLAYGITNRLSVAANLPFISYDRSSLYEHYGNSAAANPDHKRFSTDARGIGDLRLSGTYWLFNPETHMTYNIAVGLGLKLPTGNENVQGEFHKRKSSDGSDSIVVKAVDQSIQLGDGGVGISLELQAFTSIFKNGTLYFNGFYMSNPQETNKTVNRVITPTTTDIQKITAFHSIADQYVARLGLNYAILPAQGLAVNLGVRAEGIPAKDLIGGSKGFRRPGYIVSAEPGVSFQRGRAGFSLNIPYALYRNRVKSVSDLADPTGQAHGDAAFADYSINAGVVWRFGGHNMAPMPNVPQFKNATN